MKNLKLLFLVTLCLMLSLGIANATIVIDETFDDGTPFTDLGWAYGVDNPTSAAVKGITVARTAGPGGNPVIDALFTMPPTATLTYNATSGNLQGSLKNLGTGNGKAWQLKAGQKIFWGESGNALYPSGGGVIFDQGADIKIAQVGLGYDVTQIPNNPTGLIGSVSYLFGNTLRTTTTFSLTYELRPKTAASAELRELRSDGSSKTLGLVLPNKFALLTTVWAANTDVKWGTIPKTGWGMTIYPSSPGSTGIPRGYGWQVNRSYTSPTDVNSYNTYEGSADGRLYPKGKGWANGTGLTSSTKVTSGTLQPNTAIYSFLDTKPASYGTTASRPLDVDSPWLIPTVLYPVPGKVSVASTSETSKLRTWKIASGSGTSTTLYVDDLYLETQLRGANPTSVEAKAADYRLHEFDQTLIYGPTSTTLKPNLQYVGPTGLPVELSIFEVR